MSQLAAFLRGSDTRLGVFYPEHALFAIYPSIEQAQKAGTKLHAAGFGEKEALAVTGADFAELLQEETAKDGIFGLLMTELSRFFHTEAAYTDRDLAHAKRGGAVLAVLCPEERTKDAAWSVLAPTHPLAARYYAADGIDHLAGET